jgi:ribosomal-protein-alanine N-acetyltransferase
MTAYGRRIRSMTHIGTQTIETERLILRRLEAGDAPAMFKNWCSNSEVTKYLSWPTHQTLSDTEEVLTRWLESYEKDDFYLWGITVKENGPEPIGSISVVEKDDRAEWVAIGYCIGREWWGKGIVPEALAGVIKFLFENVDVNRIEASHDPANPASGAVMRKCGMTYEGTLRQGHRNNQGIHDLAVYAILKEEYFA